MSQIRNTFILIFFFVVCYSYGQMRWEVGGAVGGANYLGEMGGDKKSRRSFIADMKLSQTKFAFGAFLRHRRNPFLAYKLNLNYASISGADSLSSNPGRNSRNLHFRSPIIEFSGQAELTLYKNRSYGTRYLLIGSRGRVRYDFSVYTFLGAGGFYFNPQAKYNGEWVSLQPLGTEGQGVNKYSRLQMNIPIGIGFYQTVNRKFRIGYELGLRTTFTDYLDDVSGTYADPSELDSDVARDLANRSSSSQYAMNDPSILLSHGVDDKRGDSKHADSYIFGTINIGYVFRGRPHHGPHFRSFSDLFSKQNARKRKSNAKFK